MNRIVSAALALVLVAAVALQVVGKAGRGESTLRKPLRALLPEGNAGWKSVNVPIAETDEMKKAVGELLNYDDAVFRRYTRGQREFDVYVAYWRPGKMSPRLVAGHTPDICWPAAGWTLVAYDTHGMEAAGRRWPNAQRRAFAANGTKRHVVFWHWSGTEAIAHEPGKGPPWWTPIADVFRHGLNQRREQIFIRISSADPMEALINEPVFQEVLRSLPFPVAVNQ